MTVKVIYINVSYIKLKTYKMNTLFVDIVNLEW